jgi:hypothetical protein
MVKFMKNVTGNWNIFKWLAKRFVFFSAIASVFFRRTELANAATLSLARCGKLAVDGLSNDQVDVHYLHAHNQLDKLCAELGPSEPEVHTMYNAANWNAFFCGSYEPDFSGKCGPYVKLKKRKISPATRDVILLNEGEYAIFPVNNIVATANISFCVGVALTNRFSSQAFLGHFAAENILMSDQSLARGELPDWAYTIKRLIDETTQGYWKARLVSGSLANIAYIKAVLEYLGIENVKVVYNSQWMISYSPETHASISGGSIMIQDNRVSTIENKEDFVSRIEPILFSRKNMPLKLIDVSPELAPVEEEENEDEHVARLRLSL